METITSRKQMDKFKKNLDEIKRIKALNLLSLEDVSSEKPLAMTASTTTAVISPPSSSRNIAVVTKHKAPPMLALSG